MNPVSDFFGCCRRLSWWSGKLGTEVENWEPLSDAFPRTRTRRVYGERTDIFATNGVIGSIFFKRRHRFLTSVFDVAEATSTL